MINHKEAAKNLAKFFKEQGGVGGHIALSAKTDTPPPKKSRHTKHLPQPHPFTLAALHYARHIALNTEESLPMGLQAPLNQPYVDLLDEERDLKKAIQLVTDYLPPMHREKPLAELEAKLVKVREQIKEME